MTERPSAVIRFSEEELVVLYAETVSYPEGLPYQELLPQYDAEQRTLALNVAKRGLIARGIMEIGNDGMHRLNELAIAAAAAGLILDPALMFLQQGSDGTIQASELYELDEKTRMMHSQVDDGFHEFRVLNDGEALLAALRISAGLPDESFSSNGAAMENSIEVTLPSEALEQALVTGTTEDVSAVAAILSKAGAPAEAILPLAETLAGSCHLATIVKRDRTDVGAAVQQALVFVHGNDRWWQIEQVDTDSPITLQSVSTSVADQTVRDFAELQID